MVFHGNDELAKSLGILFDNAGYQKIGDAMAAVVSIFVTAVNPLVIWLYISKKMSEPRLKARLLSWLGMMSVLAITPFVQIMIFRHTFAERKDVNDLLYTWLFLTSATNICLIFFLLTKRSFHQRLDSDRIE